MGAPVKVAILSSKVRVLLCIRVYELVCIICILVVVPTYIIYELAHYNMHTS